MHVSIIEAGHHKLGFGWDRRHALRAAAAIEQGVIHLANASDNSVADGHGLGPRMRRVIRVNPAVDVIGRERSFLCRAGFHVESRKERDNKWENSGKESRAIRPHSHRDFSSATPETPRMVRRGRFKPASRRAASYHSSTEGARPPFR